MLWRHLSRFRAWSAAGFLTCSVLGTAPASAEPEGPVPTAETAASETVSVLDAVQAGDLTVVARGAGQDRVKITVTNTTKRRLRVVLPPGLVASSAAGQGRGFQSMGLGSVSNRIGSFGAFQARKADEPSGFRSVAVNGGESAAGVAVPAGRTVDLTVVSVCLNFGVRTPNAHDRFQLVDVDDYTSDPRARKALRSLATYGTSHGVAQAAMWRVSNDVPFTLMAEQSGKVMNAHEVALAARFVEALDASSSSDLVDPAYLTDDRLFVRVAADGPLAGDADRLTREIAGLRVLGLPVRTSDSTEGHAANRPAVLMNVVLSAGPNGETKGRILLSQTDGDGRWAPLGKAAFTDGSSPSVLDGEGLARAVDRAVALAYVTVKVAKKLSNVTMIRV
ncbi:MAG: hypothetical protein LC745_02780, partial [Planctomycetia bacterium]|nr:hypothetical protein [Planctomycetia bacterium]